MMNRVRRTVRQKSPSPTSDETSKKSSSYPMFSGGGGSPILTHRTAGAGGGVGLGASYAITLGGYRSTQVRIWYNGCFAQPDVCIYVCLF